MLDLVLSILALIAGGMVLELFAGTPDAGGESRHARSAVARASDGLEEVFLGNPS